MATNSINAELLKKMFLAGAASIESQKEYINELNVFPVPDGDTGTNMSLTIMAAAKEVNNIEVITMEALAKAISSGSLRGARGNSGVILSQLFRGFTKAIKVEEEITVEVLAKACEKATETAYKAVMKPKEGTILTVAKGISNKAIEMCDKTDDLAVFIPEVIKHAEYVLSKTPDMLPVLKEAGVVDSGGQGLLEVIKGAYDAFLGKEIDYSVLTTKNEPVVINTTSNIPTGDIEFGYCTEFIIMVDKKFDDSDEDKMKEYLSSIGDSIVCVADDDIVKIHVHTNDPGLAIQKALTYGALTRMKIDNMREEHEEQIRKEAEKAMVEKKALEPRKEMGFIAVSIGSGMNEIFKELGVDYIIEGGQTMNPSTEDMLNAIDQVNADSVFILPNNKNIILAANQAKDLTEDKNIIVIPTKTVPQGITAMINYVVDASASDNEEHMTSEIENIQTGQVTYAVRDTKIDDKEITQGDIMGIADAGILAVGKGIAETSLELLEQLIDDDSEFVSIYYGEDISEEDAHALAASVEEKFPDVEIDVHSGGQPIYYYVMSVE
ncbi:MAG: DAK2 domain-containing protein [Eubacteriales bacterium]